MTGILYLILGSLCGKELAEIFVGQKKTGKITGSGWFCQEHLELECLLLAG